jgi:p-hydroxybenzoate 3-monooxygenase
MKNQKIPVCIIGAGPAGLTLALLLHQQGIESIVLESRSQSYVESRVRAGLLEHNTVQLFDQLGVSQRLHQQGLVHHGCYITHNGKSQRIDFQKHTHKQVTIYGQQEVVKDLIQACQQKGIQILFETEVTNISNFESQTPTISTTSSKALEGRNTSTMGLNPSESITADFIAGCDGFHGISRKTLPKDTYNEYKIEYPFSWLGILAHAAPTYEELIYAYHDNGFALASMRSEKVCRLYLQVANQDKIENWTDQKIWQELEIRLGTTLNQGEIFEKSITPLRSYMIDNMQHGNLFLAGDAAHIVPPTGAKGLNLAVADVQNLATALIAHYKDGNDQLLANYTQKCLARVWRVQDFSNFMTYLCHKNPNNTPFETQLQKAKFDYLQISDAYQKTIAENYVGLPYDLFHNSFT